MTSSPAQRAKLAQEYSDQKRKPGTTPSRTFVNSTTTGLYTGNNMRSARADADQHKQYTGAGFQAQIDRRTV